MAVPCFAQKQISGASRRLEKQESDSQRRPTFDQSWPIIRMLVVDPASRGAGVGRALTEECISRARRDGSRVIALHSSPIMTVALPIYLRMGFQLVQDAPPIYGVPYAVYLNYLDG